MYTDEELIELLSRDEAEAIKGIYRKYWNELLDYAFGLIHDEAQAKDIVQEMFVRMVAKEYLKGIQSSLRSYLFLSVKRDCVRFLQREPAIETLDTSLEDSFERFISATHKDHSAHSIILKELELHYEKELSGLPLRMKQVFELSRKQGFSSREISIRLEVSDQTVKNQITNALRILRGKLQLD
ncbi:MAG: sigma-70 family RNA polymerase sigma factor [Chitinophagaceae bacterium]|nr:sigma-70 family RNA polymerase sigma factor [Chitinophagaceae bacterium]